MDVGLWGTVGEGRPVGPVKVLDCRDVESVVEIRKDTNRATHLGNFVNMFILKGGKSTASPGGELNPKSPRHTLNNAHHDLDCSPRRTYSTSPPSPHLTLTAFEKHAPQKAEMATFSDIVATASSLFSGEPAPVRPSIGAKNTFNFTRSHGSSQSTTELEDLDHNGHSLRSSTHNG